MKKRFLCLALALTMALGNIGTAETYAKTSETGTRTGMEKLASYSARGSEELHRTMSLCAVPTDAADAPTEEQVASAPLFTDTAAAGEYLREQMKQRVPDIILRVSGGYDDETISVFHEAVRHTGISDEGDALNCQRDTTKTGAWQNQKANECVYRYTFTYRTTLSEEQELKNALKRIEAEIPWGSTADEEMHAVRGVYRYLIENYAYDSVSAEKHKTGITAIAQDKTAAQSYVAYGAYKNKQAVCQGLAEFLYRILLDRGVDTRILFSSTHAWNAVEVEGEWYMCDATGDVQKGFRDVPEHYLLSRSDLAALGSVYNWNADTVWDYAAVDAYNWAAREWNDLAASVIRDFKNVVKLVKGNKTGKQKATLTDANGKKLKEGTDYTVSYEYGNYKDRYNTKVVYTGKGKYTGTVEKYYNRTVEAPQIVRIEQRVVDTITNANQYQLETCVYVKAPTTAKLVGNPCLELIFKQFDGSGKEVFDTSRPLLKGIKTSRGYTLKSGKGTKMKDGTWRYVFYTKLRTTKYGGRTLKSPVSFQLRVCGFGSLNDQTISFQSTKIYTIPAIKGTFSLKTKRTYNAAKIKKLKQKTLKNPGDFTALDTCLTHI